MKDKLLAIVVVVAVAAVVTGCGSASSLSNSTASGASSTIASGASSTAASSASSPAASGASSSVVSSSAAESSVSGAATYKQISQEEAQELMKSESDYVIVDARRQDEFDSGHIPGAICIPNESIEQAQPVELPDLDQLIMVYCRSGNRSKQASEKLANMGYTNVVEFGGINTWPGEVVTD